MASKLSLSLLRGFGRPTLRQTASKYIIRATYSTEAPPPPLLSKLKDDLKTAMRAKDANRLAVLRSILAAALNASKTDKPIRTDAQLVSLLQKSALKSQEAAAEARRAGREDLAEKEEAQQRILEEYAAGSGVRELGEAELRQLIESTKANLLAEGVQEKALSGQIIKKLFTLGGPLDGVVVEKKEVVKLVMESCQAK
ncbi:hypothetical protein MYCTH_2299157 [Thermothelomyces thermophilus ATCC 42464]|uniref:Altered inheritance of mitochondria protein 41 n=1 Tax=Thermothelomyces thermophilus (strain ATCC 42464 / BCRC 31852 / DSM 1799) TaxID=573729 RepID=G2Q4V0_THET4|nr:uncharacterized protein MYCTH_2299157 [Thermothelomyces thermophilus ATCC 42464]AEO55389.1 hypothetical protein MYCTH_2299157 [Thermothelomyces thermophilus ATCC 42464]